MRKNTFYIAAAALSTVAATIALVSSIGCDAASDYEITISPSYSEVVFKNDSVSLTASGWSGYKWSLSDYNIGRLDRTEGESVTYYANYMVEKEIIQNVYVTGLKQSESTASATNKNTVYKGVARIRHIVPGDILLSIEPASSTLTKDDLKRNLSATPGWDEYKWRFDVPDIGTLVPDNKANVLYTMTELHKTNNNQKVWVRATKKIGAETIVKEASASIVQKP